MSNSTSLYALAPIIYYDKNEGYVTQTAQEDGGIAKMGDNEEGRSGGGICIGEKIRTISTD
jgi:hypothetical protein